MDKWRLGSFALGVVVTTIVLTSYIFLQQASPAQQNAQAPIPAQSLQVQKFKVSGSNRELPGFFLPIDAGKDRGIYAGNGLDPEFITVPRPVLAAEIKELIGSGIKMGFSNPSEVLLARADGAPVKIVASVTGRGPSRVYVKSDSAIISVKDLDGKKVGTTDLANVNYRQLLYLNSKFGIKLEPVPLGNLTDLVVALKLGNIDAFITTSVVALALVDTGELRILVHFRDLLPNPQVAAIIWATDDAITQNPDLVRRFVKATLEVGKYLKENPGYTADLFMRRTNAPKDLADKTISDLDWTPSGRGTGSDLTAAVANFWQFNKDSGAIPASTWEKVKIEDAVDVRFIPK